MAGSKRQKPPVTAAPLRLPPSPTTKATKITSKDGSKFITMPKGVNVPVESPQHSPALARPTPVDSKDTTESKLADAEPSAPTVNRKKQKRREKAKLKAGGQPPSQAQGANAGTLSPTVSASPSLDRRSLDVNYDDSEVEGDDYEAEGEEANHPRGNGSIPSKSKKSKKKKKKASQQQPQQHTQDDELDEDDGYDQEDDDRDEYDYEHHHHEAGHRRQSNGHLPPLRMSPHNQRQSQSTRPKIWGTSSIEERERIKDFWLGLGEDERKSLVKVEKEAVLNKMKEQQRQTCSCSVCGRKRTAIEEELEQLYDAYYKELETFANREPGQQQPHYGPGTGVHHPSQGQASNHTHQPSHGRIVEHPSDEDDDDYEDEIDAEEQQERSEEYSDTDGQIEDQYDSDEEETEDVTKDFFQFGNSLTVQGGILTVADDLLKNDGKKFIEMMEKLAEKRMQREEDAFRLRSSYSHTNGNSTGYGNHTHDTNTNNNPPPQDDDEDYEDEDEEYTGDDGDEEYDTDEENRLTESQRMEEGRRMFQIFAARMFEQRVLLAYRQKLSKERQEEIIRDLELEKQREAERKERKRLKQQEAKDRARQKKLEAQEAKERKAAEKKAQEDAQAAEVKRKQDEQRQLAEKKREQKRIEEERKAQEVREAKEKKAEQERKAREQKQKEKNAKERKEREARESREREERERKEKQERQRREQQERKEQQEQEERERKEQQEREKKEREAKIQADLEAKEKKVKAQKLQQLQQQQAIAASQKPQPPTAASITIARRPAQNTASSPAPPPALPHQASSISTTVASPQVPIATPVIPLAPTPMRARQESQQEGGLGSSAPHSVSSTSQVPSPHPMTPEQHTSPGPFGPRSKAGSIAGQGGYQSSQHASPMGLPVHPSFNYPSGQFGGFGAPPAVNGGHFSSGPPGLQQPLGFGSQPSHGGFAPPPFGSGAGFPSAIGSLPGMSNRPAHSRGVPPGFGQPNLDTQFSSIGGQGFPTNNSALHQRQSSIGGGFDAAPGTPLLSSSQPRPTPIGRRPGSVAQGQRPPPGLSAAADGGWGKNDNEQPQYGSSALLTDSEEVVGPSPMPTARRNTSVPGPTYSQGFYGDSAFSSHSSAFPSALLPLNSPPPTVPPGLPSPWQTASSLPNSSVFSSQLSLHSRPQESHHRVRQRFIDAWLSLKSIPGLPEEAQLDGDWIALDRIKGYLMQQDGHSPNDQLLSEILETLGDNSNGGGTFQTRWKNGHTYVRWIEDDKINGHHRPVHRAVGHDAIGSPVVTNSAVPISRGSS